MIESLVSASPPVEAIKAEPYTVDELDALPEPFRARMWATLVAVREELIDREATE